jgi:hypothetical protein
LVSATRELDSLNRRWLVNGRSKFVGCLANLVSLSRLGVRFGAPPNRPNRDAPGLGRSTLRRAVPRVCPSVSSGEYRANRDAPGLGRSTLRWAVPRVFPSVSLASYLVDSSSSHMLVSKIKPCMSKYKPQQGETANGSLNHT